MKPEIYGWRWFGDRGKVRVRDYYLSDGTHIKIRLQGHTVTAAVKPLEGIEEQVYERTVSEAVLHDQASLFMAFETATMFVMHQLDVEPMGSGLYGREFSTTPPLLDLAGLNIKHYRVGADDARDL